jgi:hypothetical protein
MHIKLQFTISWQRIQTIQDSLLKGDPTILARISLRFGTVAVVKEMKNEIGIAGWTDGKFIVY